jgi:hypothetical protein
MATHMQNKMWARLSITPLLKKWRHTCVRHSVLVGLNYAVCVVVMASFTYQTGIFLIRSGLCLMNGPGLNIQMRSSRRLQRKIKLIDKKLELRSLPADTFSIVRTPLLVFNQGDEWASMAKNTSRPMHIWSR